MRDKRWSKWHSADTVSRISGPKEAQSKLGSPVVRAPGQEHRSDSPVASKHVLTGCAPLCHDSHHPIVPLVRESYLLVSVPTASGPTIV